MANPKPFTGLTTKQLNQVLQLPAVTAALDSRAARILPRTKAIALSANALVLADSLKVKRGTRPGTAARDGLQRPYARVYVEVTPELLRRDSKAKLTRQQILRRGAING